MKLSKKLVAYLTGGAMALGMTLFAPVAHADTDCDPGPGKTLWHFENHTDATMTVVLTAYGTPPQPLTCQFTLGASGYYNDHPKGGQVYLDPNVIDDAVWTVTGGSGNKSISALVTYSNAVNQCFRINDSNSGPGWTVEYASYGSSCNGN